MDHKEFIQNALKTESVVDELKIDRRILIDTFKLFVMTTELLDAIKKKVFYGNPKKYDQVYIETFSKMVSLIYTIGYNYERLKEGVYEEEYPEDVNTRIAHGVIGVASEAGELVECLLKSLESGEPLDMVNLAEELFDGDWYKVPISDECNIEWENEWERIINKLRVRFGEKFSEGSANNRNLDAERKVLEGK